MVRLVVFHTSSVLEKKNEEMEKTTTIEQPRNEQKNKSIHAR